MTTCTIWTPSIAINPLLKLIQKNKPLMTIDLNKWGEVIAKHLKKGGTFLLVEIHPFVSLFEVN
ncbi:hypothetical protein N9Y89_00050 [bacterium]|nr:hypothetical protein [bacterium]